MRIALVVLLAVCVAACSKKAPDRKSFQAAWEKAQKAGDAKAGWALLDKATRDRIVGAVGKAIEANGADKVRRKTMACVNETISVDGDAATVARDLFRVWFVADGGSIADDGTTERVHLEDGAWKIGLEPVGFTDAEGRPLTLALRLDAPAAPGARESYDFAPEFIGKNQDEIRVGVASAIGGMSAVASLPGYTPLAARVISCDLFTRVGGEGKVIEMRYQVDASGGVTPMVGAFDDATAQVVSAPAGQLRYGAWP